MPRYFAFLPMLALVSLLSLGFAPLAALAQDATPAGGPAATPALPPGATVAATGLANPRGVAVADDGGVYVAEAGLGGSDPFESPAFGPSTRGTSGQVSRIAPDGTKAAVATGLPSFALGGFEVVGPAGLVTAQGALWLATSHFVPGVGPRPNEAAVLRVDPASGAVTTVGDLGAAEQEANPDGFIIESDPYGLVMGADGNLYVAEAGANALYRVDPASGQLSRVTVFAGLLGTEPNPARNNLSESDPVPTGIAAAPDGSLYVGFLSGFPFLPGTAKVVRVAPDGTTTDAVTGVTAVADVELGPDGLLYVVEFGTFDATTQPPGWAADSGRVLRILADGTQEVVAQGLNKPNGMAFDTVGNLYLGVNSDVPPQAGPQGMLVRLDGVAIGAAPATPVMYEAIASPVAAPATPGA
ncbi:MAG: ScyD/ScyE family protein [Chloroflexota bacterium]|nr:ScyD/ScyE family protein [Chloroflexota bacterium]